MPLQDAAGTTLSAAQVQAKVTTVTQAVKVRVDSPVWETYVPEGRTKGHGVTRRVKWAPGDIVLQSEIDAYFAKGGPTITSVSPTTVAVAGNTLVTVNGSNLDRATGATLGGTAVTQFTIVSPNKLTFRSPARAANAAVPIVVQGVPANSGSTNVVVA